MVGFDMVDDESKPERRPTKHMPTPAQWNNPFNPAYSYWAYYVYANLYILNKVNPLCFLRKNITFQFHTTFVNVTIILDLVNPHL